VNPLGGVLDALDNVRANPLRSFLTMLGVVIGVFAVVALVSIGEGVQRFVTREFAGLGTNVLIVTPGAARTAGGPPITGLDSTYKLTIADCDVLLPRAPAAKAVCPLILASGDIKRGGKTRKNTTVLGTTWEIQEIRNFYVEIGRFLPRRESGSADKRVCVLGRKVVAALYSPGESPLATWLKIGGTPYRVIGVMERKGYSLGFDIDDLVFIPVKAAEELFDTDELFEILIQARTADAVDAAKEQVSAVLKRRHDDHEDFTVTDQRSMLQAVDRILGVLTTALAGIAGISLLVGGIGIMNIMLVSVGEKTREIGLRKAVGATRGAILWQFLVESLTLSLLGGLVGAALGVGLALLVGLKVPVSIQPWTLILSLSFALATGLFFGVYPAKKAAELDPIEALRYE
jgi:putative ABC transport system permease protein